MILPYVLYAMTSNDFLVFVSSLCELQVVPACAEKVIWILSEHSSHLEAGSDAPGLSS